MTLGSATAVSTGRRHFEEMFPEVTARRRRGSRGAGRGRRGRGTKRTRGSQLLRIGLVCEGSEMRALRHGPSIGTHSRWCLHLQDFSFRRARSPPLIAVIAPHVDESIVNTRGSLRVIFTAEDHDPATCTTWGQLSSLFCTVFDRERERHEILYVYHHATVHRRSLVPLGGLFPGRIKQGRQAMESSRGTGWEMLVWSVPAIVHFDLSQDIRESGTIPSRSNMPRLEHSPNLPRLGPGHTN